MSIQSLINHDNLLTLLIFLEESPKERRKVPKVHLSTTKVPKVVESTGADGYVYGCKCSRIIAVLHTGLRKER